MCYDLKKTELIGIADDIRGSNFCAGLKFCCQNDLSGSPGNQSSKGVNYTMPDHFIGRVMVNEALDWTQH